MNIKSARPISPHLAIYKMQITSGLSVLHRVSGMLLFIGLLCLSWWICYFVFTYGEMAANNICNVDVVLQMRENLVLRFFSSFIGQIILIMWSYCLFYHICAGIRHLFWDCGIGFKRAQVNCTAMAVIFCSVILCAFTWVYAYLVV